MGTILVRSGLSPRSADQLNTIDNFFVALSASELIKVYDSYNIFNSLWRDNTAYYVFHDVSSKIIRGTVVSGLSLC